MYIYIREKCVIPLLCTLQYLHITLSLFDLRLSSFVAFCYTFTKRSGKRYRDILQFVVLDRIYTYICIHICIPCLFEYLFRISGNSLLRTSLLIDQIKRDLSNRDGAAILISYRRYGRNRE